MKRYLIAASVLVLAACQTTIPLKNDYTGALPATSGGGVKVKLALDIADQNGKPYEPKSLVAYEYRKLAESGLQKAGYVIAPEAEIEVRVALKGRTPNGVVNNESSTGRNIAVSAVTLGVGCGEMVHTVDAVGQVVVVRNGRSVIDQPLDMKASDTSCFSTLNPSWLKQHQEAGVRTYESAVTQHVGAWLLLVGSGS